MFPRALTGQEKDLQHQRLLAKARELVWPVLDINFRTGRRAAYIFCNTVSIC